jgi:hypothetical protein
MKTCTHENFQNISSARKNLNMGRSKPWMCQSFAFTSRDDSKSEILITLDRSCLERKRSRLLPSRFTLCRSQQFLTAAYGPTQFLKWSRILQWFRECVRFIHAIIQKRRINQNDQLHLFLQYAARLRLPDTLSHSQKMQYVDHIIDVLELGACQDTST